ncbi:hypothetical protein [Anaerobacillus alkaliphilus]|nr:hypothetical protein [Anaerobacillus alkaliphilus]
MSTNLLKKTHSETKKKKRITTVPQFDSTRRLMEQNKKIVSLVTNK